MISVIIPFKNSEKWLARCLESCKKQRSEDLEFVLVADNDIKDKSWEIAREYELSDKRFKLFYNQEDDGVSGARNTGIYWANGEWIGFLDSDDELCPEYASKLRIAQREYSDQFNIYQFNTYRIYDAKNTIPKMKYVNDGGLYDVQNGFADMPKEWCMVWNKIYRASFLKENNITFENFVQFGEDVYIRSLDSGIIEVREDFGCGNKIEYFETFAKMFERYEEIKEPLIKDKEIRNMIRLWAKIHNTDTLRYLELSGIAGHFLKAGLYTIDIDIETLRTGRYYTVKQLCGE